MRMRWVGWPRNGLLALVAVASCQLDRGDRVDHPPPSPPPPSITAPATALVPPPLAWGLSEQDAFDVLVAAGARPRADAQHGYVTSPTQFHAAPGTIEVAHTVEPVILYDAGRGLRGTVHYPTVGGAIDRIEVQGTLTADEAKAELRALERRHGAPTDRHTYPGDAPAVPGAERWTWVRGGVWLVAIAGPDGGLSIYYRRDARPASDIAP